jgi:hypothetical protein
MAMTLTSKDINERAKRYYKEEFLNWVCHWDQVDGNFAGCAFENRGDWNGWNIIDLWAEYMGKNIGYNLKASVHSWQRTPGDALVNKFRNDWRKYWNTHAGVWNKNPREANPKQKAEFETLYNWYEENNQNDGRKNGANGGNLWAAMDRIFRGADTTTDPASIEQHYGVTFSPEVNAILSKYSTEGKKALDKETSKANRKENIESARFYINNFYPVSVNGDKKAPWAPVAAQLEKAKKNGYASYGNDKEFLSALKYVVKQGYNDDWREALGIGTRGPGRR